MSSNPVISSAGRPLSASAVALMLMLCLSWGFNQIAVKLALPDIPPMLIPVVAWLGRRPGGIDHLAPDVRHVVNNLRAGRSGSRP